MTNQGQQARDDQVALFLHTLGDEVLQANNGFHFQTADNARTVDEILNKFDEYAIGEVNETYERYVVFNIVDRKRRVRTLKFFSQPSERWFVVSITVRTVWIYHSAIG